MYLSLMISFLFSHCGQFNTIIIVYIVNIRTIWGFIIMQLILLNVFEAPPGLFLHTHSVHLTAHTDDDDRHRVNVNCSCARASVHLSLSACTMCYGLWWLEVANRTIKIQLARSIFPSDTKHYSPIRLIIIIIVYICDLSVYLYRIFNGSIPAEVSTVHQYQPICVMIYSFGWPAQ